MLASDPRKRISALEAVQHRWVSEGGGEQAVGQGVLGQLRMYEVPLGLLSGRTILWL